MSDFKKRIFIPARIDSFGQILIELRVLTGNVVADVLFKMDNGCNSVMLNHKTLRNFGINTSPKALEKYPVIGANIVDGSDANFRQIGNFSISYGKMHIATVPVICHAQRETRNLLGTSVLHKFSKYAVNVKGYFQSLELYD
jgi:predicted aspartyl protease